MVNFKADKKGIPNKLKTLTTVFYINYEGSESFFTLIQLLNIVLSTMNK